MTSARPTPAALPLYVQISELLIRDIAAGRLADGARLPPERRLAEDLSITVRTLRKALAILAEKGLLERRQGSGNYIRSNPQVQSVYSMFRLELADGGGGLPTARLLEVEEIDKPADLPPFGTASRATRIRRLRLLNRQPVAVEEIWLDAGAGRLRRAQISDSLYHSYQQQLGFWITRAEDRVGLAPVPGWAPGDFGPPPGAPCPHVRRLSWAQAPAPVEFSRSWFDAARADYVQRLN